MQTGALAAPMSTPRWSKEAMSTGRRRLLAGSAVSALIVPIAPIAVAVLLIDIDRSTTL